MTRYALYFTPAADSAWWHAGCRWLGRDPESGAESVQRPIAGLSADMLRQLTAEARRYGIHASLRTPFHLAEGFAESHLHAMVDAFCAMQKPIVVEGVRVRPLHDFLALRPDGPLVDIRMLAMHCLDYFDLLRKPPEAEELARYRRMGLTARQETLLERWGYPYVEEEFRFHLTLTGSLDKLSAGSAEALKNAAQDCFAGALAAEPLVIDALAIFKEEWPGQAFTVSRRIPFGARSSSSPLPEGGRLFYIVGPSGVGKDTIVQWARERICAADRIVFARRISTRPDQPSSAQESVDTRTFLDLEASGFFAMTWQANGFHYGVARGIEAELAAGCHVVVNGSREHVPRLRLKFPETRIIWVDADAALIRQRIETRNRESGTALQGRLERGSQFPRPLDPEIIHLDNSGPTELAGQRLLQILRDVQEPGRK